MALTFGSQTYIDTEIKLDQEHASVREDTPHYVKDLITPNGLVPMFFCAALQKEAGDLGGQELCPCLEVSRADIRDRMRADQVGKVGYAQQARVSLGRRDKDTGDNRCRGKSLLL